MKDDLPKSYEFDRDTDMQIVEQSPQCVRFSLTVSDRWSFGVAPNGGFTGALLAKAGRLALPEHPDPVSITTQFVMPAKAQVAEITVRILRRGGRLSQTTIELTQQGQVCAQATAVFAKLSTLKGVSHFQGARPQLPSLDECKPVTGGGASFRARVDSRFFPASAACWPQGGGEEMRNAGWIKMADARPNDALSLLVFADAFPRALAMRSGRVGWIPTIDYTVQVLQPPADGHIACLFHSRKIYAGLLEEQGELWDGQGNLVALCRQSAVPRIPMEAAAWADDPGDFVPKTEGTVY